MSVTPLSSTPTHIAIIMDGNRRWAQARGLPSVFGHREGVKAVRRAVRAAADLGVKVLTLFSFSTENWTRPPDEVEYLLQLLRQYVDTDLQSFVEEGARVRIIGDREALTGSLRAIIERVEAATAHNRTFELRIAFNYGGRNELVRAARQLVAQAQAGALDAADVDEARLAACLDTPDVPDPDLIVRTSGEQRISNFLLWQGAYAEFVFQDVLWPDFGRDHLQAALDEYERRERRFGGEARVDAG